jgi:hypothetical protein
VTKKAGPERPDQPHPEGGRSGIRPAVSLERTGQKPGRRAVPFHPILFAIAPILFVYAHNGIRIPIDPRELLVPIALSLAVTAMLWTIAGLMFRSAARAALVVSLFLVLFFTYGHIAEKVAPAVYASAELLLAWTTLMGIGVWLAARHQKRRPRGSLFGLTVLLNAVAVGILAVNLAPGVRAFANRPPRIEHAAGPGRVAADPGSPDIYYIITDSYVRSDVLKSRYQTDNSAFIDELRRLGFYVADRARSNYSATHLSLASSLNFTYLDSLAQALGPEATNVGPLVEMMQDSRLVDFLRRRGYTIASFASSHIGTDLAGPDVHFAPPWSLSEFQNLLVSTTLLRDVLIMMHGSSVDRHRDRVLYTLRHLPDAGLGRHPVFVFAHILSPHRPIIFGKPVMRPGLSPFAAVYGGQVLYLNKPLIDVVQRILAQSPRPPVIIVQADHGIRDAITWGDSARSHLLERHAILDALYLPPTARGTRPADLLYDSISPVNTFRIVLSQYFDTTLALLPDRSYYSLPERPYHFYDIDKPESYSTLKGTPAAPTESP